MNNKRTNNSIFIAKVNNYIKNKNTNTYSKYRIISAFAVFMVCTFLVGCGAAKGNLPGEYDNNDQVIHSENNQEETKTGDKTGGEEISSDANTIQMSFGDESLSNDVTSEEDIILGDEQFESYLPLLDNKRVAIFTNQTGIVGDVIYDENGNPPDENLINSIRDGSNNFGDGYTTGDHILDVLLDKKVNVVEVLTPEHGFGGTADAGAAVSDTVDEKTGVTICSLYGSGKDLSGIDADSFDVVVIDIQDIGLRYYTYYITMYYLLDWCAINNKEAVILDRPNPNGFYIDGPLIEEGYTSQVGMLPICVVHGMTLGELAQMMNGEGWFTAGEDTLNLSVIPCKNYNHSMKPYIICNPSPNIKNMRAVYLYASTCFFENTRMSVARGTSHPFEQYGCPELEGVKGYEYSFVPESMEGATSPQYEGKTCYGINLKEEALEDIWDAGINLNILMDAYYTLNEQGLSLWGTADKKGRYWIDMLSGSADLREQIIAGKSAKEIKDSWSDDIEAFREARRPYLLYEE